MRSIIDRCACGRTWTSEAWVRLPLVEYWTVVQEYGKADTLELKDCSGCGNRLGQIMKAMRRLEE